MSTAQIIEFETLARFTPTVKWPSDEQRGKVIPFISQREASDGAVCAAHEDLDSEFFRRSKGDEGLYRAALEYAQPLNTGRRAPVGELLERHGEELFGVLILGLFSDGGPIGS